jgi:hypothetical protein
MSGSTRNALRPIELAAMIVAVVYSFGDSAESIGAMTYNIRNDTVEDGENTWA